MSELREIKRPVPTPEAQGYRQTEHSCPRCGSPLRWGPIACPDGRQGCLVLHYGLRCLPCGRDFENV